MTRSAEVDHIARHLNKDLSKTTDLMKALARQTRSEPVDYRTQDSELQYALLSGARQTLKAALGWLDEEFPQD